MFGNNAPAGLCVKDGRSIANPDTMRNYVTPTPSPAPVYDSYNPPETKRQMVVGTKGEDVYWVQMRLKELGYYTGTVTGEYRGGTEKAALQASMAELLERYLEAFGGSRNAMFRLKENWHMLIGQFEGSEKLWKRLRKTTDLEEYKAITGEIFATLPLKQNNCK